MLKFILILLIGLSNLPGTIPCVTQYGQCGGSQYTGSTDCCAPSTCESINPWYSQCILSSTQSTTGCSGVYGQCGGVNWSGPTCCDYSTCTYSNPYYSQCLPPSSSSSTSTNIDSTSTPTTTQSSSTSSSTSTNIDSTSTPTTTQSSSTSSSTGSSTTQSSGCNTLYSQCNGQNWPGLTCCIDSICIYSNPFYSQCLPASSSSSSSSSGTDSTNTPTASQSSSSSSSTSSSTTTTTNTPSPTTTVTPTLGQSSSSTSSSTTPTTTASTSTSSTNQGCSAVYDQCGGSGWTGPTTCCSGSTCTYSNPYYSQCLPSGGSSSFDGSTVSSITISSGNDNRQAGVTTRYWDCCKASCGWAGKASVTNPVETCAQDGVTPVNASTQSGCTGGSAYMCNNQQPWNVSSSLSYGYAAAHISGESESDWCCACYSLIFTSGPVIGKELIVQVTNTGGDLGNNHFDLEIPGGGVGMFDGCSSQFPGPYSWGQRYGGVSQRSECGNITSVLQPGCYWRFDWFMNADNPSMIFKQVTCPSILTNNTQCIRI